MFVVDADTAEYLTRAIEAINAGRTFGQMTNVCPECGMKLDYFSERHIVMRAPNAAAGSRDVVLLIACEEYWMIDPNELGMSYPDWTPCEAGTLVDEVFGDGYQPNDHAMAVNEKTDGDHVCTVTDLRFPNNTGQLMVCQICGKSWSVEVRLLMDPGE